MVSKCQCSYTSHLVKVKLTQYNGRRHYQNFGMRSSTPWITYLHFFFYTIRSKVDLVDKNTLIITNMAQLTIEYQCTCMQLMVPRLLGLLLNHYHRDLNGDLRDCISFEWWDRKFSWIQRYVIACMGVDYHQNKMLNVDYTCM